MEGGNVPFSISDVKDLRKHVEEYYKDLFGRGEGLN
jgi:hypothetical protein